ATARTPASCTRASPRSGRTPTSIAIASRPPRRAADNRLSSPAAETVSLFHRERQQHQLAAPLEMQDDGIAWLHRIEQPAQFREPRYRGAVDLIDHVAGRQPAVARIERTGNRRSDDHSAVDANDR